MRDSFFSNSTINSIIKQRLEKRLKAYKNIKYVYAIMSKNNPVNLTIISNRQEWFKFYKENNFQFIDPVVCAALHRLTPFSWDENFLVAQGIKSLSFFNIARNHNIVNGYTFLLHDQYNNLVMLSLFSDNNHENGIEEIIETDKDKFQMLLMLTHEKTIHLYQKIVLESEFKKNE